MKKNKSKLGLTLLTTLLLPIVANSVSNNDAFAAQGWVKNGNTWYYYNKNGSPEKNKWIDGLYWLNADGKMATNSWVDNGRYYVDANGTWVKDAKRTKQGWVKQANSWYYYEANGALAKNKWIDGLYWLNSDGKMATNSWVDNGRYYVGDNGAWVKDAKRTKQGWVKQANSWYYYEANGVLAKNKWIDGLYWLNSDGKMATNSWVDNGRYFVGDNGAWVKDAKRTKQGWVKQANSWYYYEANGALAKNKWIDGLYWLNSDGKMATNSWVDNNRYYVDSNGVWVKDAKRKQGWIKQANSWYYYESNGTLARNKWIGDYWLGTDGKMATNSWVDNGYYYVDANGKWIPNYRKPIIIHSEVTKADPGNVLAGIKGEFLTPDKDAILRKINRIRKEAFDEGLPDADRYIPAKWSTDLEKTALIRSTEASISMAHKRLSNKKIWTTFPGVLAEAENLAWSNSGFDDAINQWYAEKADYIKQEKGLPVSGQTGHYRWLITPIANRIGIASFKNPKQPNGWITTALSMGGEGNSEKLAGTYGNAIVYTEVSKEKLPYVKKLADIE